MYLRPPLRLDTHLTALLSLHSSRSLLFKQWETLMNVSATFGGVSRRWWSGGARCEYANCATCLHERSDKACAAPSCARTSSCRQHCHPRLAGWHRHHRSRTGRTIGLTVPADAVQTVDGQGRRVRRHRQEGFRATRGPPPADRAAARFSEILSGLSGSERIAGTNRLPAEKPNSPKARAEGTFTEWHRQCSNLLSKTAIRFRWLVVVFLAPPRRRRRLPKRDTVRA